MRYGQHAYFQTAKQAQAEAFLNEVNEAALNETKRNELLAKKLAAAGRVVHIGRMH